EVETHTSFALRTPLSIFLQGSQLEWLKMAPALVNVLTKPACSACLNTSTEAGITTNRTFGCTVLPSTSSAASRMSASLPLEQDFRKATDTGRVSISRTGTTFSGDQGLAIRGVSLDRSRSIVRS